MKKIQTTILILFLTNYAFSQNDLLKITNENNGEKVEYFVLKDSQEVKQGEYNRYINKKLVVSGQFSNNKESGIWNYYKSKNKVYLKYDFDKDSSLFINPKESNREVKYSGDLEEIRYIVASNLRYPQSAAEKGIKGRIVVEILINKYGVVYDYIVKNDTNNVFKNEVIRIAKLIPGKWLPAIKDGKPIESKYYLPVNFAL